jgi:hypothetical protein
MPDATKNFENIAATVYRMADQPTGKDRRKYQRTPVAGHVVASIVRSDAPPISAQVLDLSRGGLGLSCAHSIKRGTQFTITVNLGSGPLKFTCRIANCRRGDDKRYIIGAEFLQIQRPVEGSNNSFASSSDPEPLDDAGNKHVAEVANRLEKLLREAK